MKLFERMKARKGFTIIETIIAAGLTILIVAALFVLVRGTTRALARSSRSTRGERVLANGISSVKSMNFYNVFAFNSDATNFGIIGSVNGRPTHPNIDGLNNFLTTVRAAGYTRFTLDVTYMRRNSTGQQQLVPFEDDGIPAGSTANDKIDDVDPTVRYFDQNLDGDFNDTYLDVTGRTISEVPNTDIKNVTLNLWEGSQIALSHTFLLTNGLFTSENVSAPDASLTLNVSTPPPIGIAYRYITAEQQAAQNLSIYYPYPLYYPASRADSVQPLTIAGITAPLAFVRFSIGNYTVITSLAADAFGSFSGNPIALTTPLVEGDNYVLAFSSRASNRSPYVQRVIRLDIRKPIFSNPFPPIGPNVHTLSPQVDINFSDDTTSTSAVSGICAAVLSLKSNGIRKTVRYNPNTATMKWVNDTTGLPETLADNTDYLIEVEGGDFAHYKENASWTFHTQLLLPDNTAPVVSNCGVSSTAQRRPTLSVMIADDQSGIVPSSIVFKVDGVDVVSQTLGNIADYYNPKTGSVSYTPLSDLSTGSHTYSLSGDHWASDAPQNGSGSCPLNIL